VSQWEEEESSPVIRASEEDQDVAPGRHKATSNTDPTATLCESQDQRHQGGAIEAWAKLEWNDEHADAQTE
jgi:hypothetical protein